MNRSTATALVLMLAAAVSIAACGATSPAQPTATALELRGAVYLTTDNGEPALPGVTVDLTSGAVQVSTLTDERGRFSIGGLSSGAWTVVFHKPSYGERRVDLDLVTDTTLNCSFAPPK